MYHGSEPQNLGITVKIKSFRWDVLSQPTRNISWVIAAAAQ